MKDIYQKYIQSTGVSIDTRSINEGELFFCLKGDRFNGNKFASQALKAGAKYVVLDDAEYYIENTAMILVEDSLKTLQDLSAYHRKQLNIPVIGITGTNGKTTTKELIHAVLSSHYNTLSTNGNFNNHIGVPLTLLRINEEHEIAVIEMGANHLGEIAELCNMVQPNFGIITNIGHAHLEGFGSFSNIIKTKIALYHAVKQSAGLVFVNQSDQLLLNESKSLRKVSYGISQDADCNVQLISKTLSLQMLWGKRKIKTKLFGHYNLYNAAAAIAIGQYFKVVDNDIVDSLEAYQPSNNRSQIEEGENNELILDAYNANPDSMKGALNFFNCVDYNRKAVVLGDMLELGDFEEKEHRKILELLEKKNFNFVMLVGPIFYNFKDEFRQFYFQKDSMSTEKYFVSNPLEDYKILLKASRGIKLEILKETLL